MSKAKMIDSLMPWVGAGLGLVAFARIAPTLYEWDLLPGVGSPAWWARAATINYHHYHEGIVYDAYENGPPNTEIPPQCKGKMYLRQKGGGWKLQSEMNVE
eukprot:NODE_23729_length_653_cov_9.665399.p2 GENE.NODE_23729_length_653_cov_9.665399~~NODE_23729_length_653_cov_9.665399.p2  ORF type:complete len:101 (+),score=26.47 NODE_23729_length_653_cov_9.665399:118-420(+)